MTPVDLIRISLKTSGVEGVGQTPDSEDVNDCFVILNAMLAQWSRKRFLIPHLIDIACLSTGAQTYTIGPAGQFNCPRPDRIEAAYVRLQPVLSTGTVDFPLSLIDAREDYSEIVTKGVQSIPAAVFYDASYPLGTVYCYPIPPAGQYEIHLILKDTLPQFPSLTTAIVLPPEYTDALIWNLSCRIRPLFGLPPDEQLVRLAEVALNTLRSANTQLPTLKMGPGVPRGRGGRWAGHGIPGYGTTS